MNTKMINVRFIENGTETGNETVPQGTPAGSLTGNFSAPDEKILALRINNSVCPVDTPVEVTSAIEPVLTGTKDGATVYRRSLCLLLAAAAYRLFPGRRLLVGHSLEHGYYYTFGSGPDITDEEAASLEKEMRRLVADDIPITAGVISYGEAAELLGRLNMCESRRQLDFISPHSVRINSIEDFSDLYFGPLVPSTGRLKMFGIMRYGKGFLLRFPRAAEPDRLTEFTDQPKLFEIYSRYKDWGRRLGVTSAASLNKLVAERKINDFIDITETLQEKNISEIADKIASSRKVRVVLIAGPSSSGKTTTSKRLALELQAIGYRPKIISLDSYYIGRDRTPRDADGNYDFECLEALDVELLNRNLMDLFNGKEVTVPSYDFHSGKRSFDEKNRMSLSADEILIMEGIHGLNDRLTPKIPSEMKFKIYISALTQLNLDDHNRISTSDNRLIRRIVRDSNFRGKPAAETISMWPNVQRGEDLHIFPFQNNADAILNTALDYELSVLRVYAEPILSRVNPTMREYSEASRLMDFLRNFQPIPPTSVPPRSIIREFIGGSAFKY